jgi:hypothetical protein
LKKTSLWDYSNVVSSHTKKMRSYKHFLSADTANLKAFLPHNPVIEIRRVTGRGRRCYKVLMWMPKDPGDSGRGSLGFIDETVAFAQIADVEHENGEYLKLSTRHGDVFELLYQKVIKPMGLQDLEIRISEKGKFWKLITPEETHSDAATELTEAQSEATKIEAVVPSGFSLGKDISFEAMSGGRIAIDEVGTPIFFVGFLDQEKHLQYRTYDIGAVHAIRDWRKTKRFLALDHGAYMSVHFSPKIGRLKLSRIDLSNYQPDRTMSTGSLIEVPGTSTWS